MSRVIFVGMHNKPGMAPLDSRTKSGRIIDMIIENLSPGIECVKTNLVDADELAGPNAAGEAITHPRLWLDRADPRWDDVEVLLGKWVQNHFQYHSRFVIVDLKHPASCYGYQATAVYVENAVSEIEVALEASLGISSSIPT